MQTIIDIREIEIDIEFTRYSGYLIEVLKVHFISGVDKKIKEEKLFYICIIDNEKECCEELGYLSTPDDYKSFIGANLLSYEVIDINGVDSEIEGEEQKLNIKTTKGDLQFSAYNYHNGYYYHDIIVKMCNEKEFINLHIQN
ncbi:MAG: hypothetical protein K2X69_03660 [Silvanigrellaceae bacterium]|nr:hypothetical protein [Silvanigrellaceae bacterium]